MAVLLHSIGKERCADESFTYPLTIMNAISAGCLLVVSIVASKQDESWFEENNDGNCMSLFIMPPVFLVFACGVMCVAYLLHVFEGKECSSVLVVGSYVLASFPGLVCILVGVVLLPFFLLFATLYCVMTQIFPWVSTLLLGDDVPRFEQMNTAEAAV
jgi:hypothetical protein